MRATGRIVRQDPNFIESDREVRAARGFLPLDIPSADLPLQHHPLGNYLFLLSRIQPDEAVA
jgi:hypothetical protein